jgi:hypothetical protein
MWDLGVDDGGHVTGVRLHDVEHWRGGVVVPATPSAGLTACRG